MGLRFLFNHMRFSMLVSKDEPEKLDDYLRKKPQMTDCVLGILGVMGPAVYFALRFGHTESARVLLEHGAKTDFITQQGMPLIFYTLGLNVFDYIKTQGERDYMSALAVKNGADLDARDDTGMNALMRACMFAQPAAADFLLDNGAAPSPAPDSKGRTALMHAISARNPEITARLLPLATDITAQDNNGMTALHYATDAKTALQLIDRGASTGVTDNQGRTALCSLPERQLRIVTDELSARTHSAREAHGQAIGAECHKPVATVGVKRVKLKTPTTS